MKTQKQMAGRTPQSPRKVMVNLTVDLPADSPLFNLPPEERNEFANRAFRVFLAKDWANWPKMQPFDVVGRVTVIPVPLVKPLAEKFAALASERDVSVSVIVGCLAETWLGGACLNDAVEQVEGLKDAARYHNAIVSALANEQVAA